MATQRSTKRRENFIDVTYLCLLLPVAAAAEPEQHCFQVMYCT